MNRRLGAKTSEKLILPTFFLSKWAIWWFLVRFFEYQQFILATFFLSNERFDDFWFVFECQKLILSTFFLSKWTIRWFLIRFLGSNSSFCQRFFFQNDRFHDFWFVFWMPTAHFGNVFPFKMSILMTLESLFWLQKFILIRFFLSKWTFGLHFQLANDFGKIESVFWGR